MHLKAIVHARALWDYRGFVLGSVKREFQSRYRASMLGAAWTVLNPLAMILIYTLVFSQVLRAKLPGDESAFGYSIYLCAGLITWGLFLEIATKGAEVFVDNANLLKKLSFPRICLPVAVLFTALINFAIIFTLFLLFLIFVGKLPGWVLLGIFPLLAVQILFSIGLGMVAGTLNVFFRDVSQFLGIALQFWFWLTPVVYPASIIPEWARSLVFTLNPMAPIISGYQTIFVAARWPDWSVLLIPTAIGLLLCVLGLYLFTARSGEMVDEL